MSSRTELGIVASGIASTVTTIPVHFQCLLATSHVRYYGPCWRVPETVVVVGSRTTSSDAQWVKEAGMSVLPVKLVPISLLPVQGAHRRIYVHSIRPLLRITVRSRGTILVTGQNLTWSDGVAISARWPHLEELNRAWTWTTDSEYFLYDISSLPKNFPSFQTSGSVRVYIGD